MTCAGRAPGRRGPCHLCDHRRLTLTLSGIQDAEQRYISIAVSGSSPAAQTQARDLNARLAGWQFEVPGYRYDALFRPLEPLLNRAGGRRGRLQCPGAQSGRRAGAAAVWSADR